MSIVFESEKKYPRCSSNVIIFDENKNILLTKRSVEPYEGFWVIPGGHIKVESPVQAAKREIFEEVGVEVYIDSLYGMYENLDKDPRRPTLSVFYIGHIVSGKMEKTIEVSESRFFDLNKLPDNIGFNHSRILKDLKEFPKGQPINN